MARARNISTSSVANGPPRLLSTGSIVLLPRR
jgi:hypothetical protein